MFGLNERVGRAFFNNAKPDELLVTSRFFTLQGEGPYRGQPAYFIRLAKCNLACFFCDTYFDSGEWRSFDSLLEEADKVIAEFFNGCNMVPPAWAQGLKKEMVLVITGGEPSLQNNLAAFLTRAQGYFNYTQIESNGTGLVSQIPVSTTLVISPKCQDKTGAIGQYLEPSKNTLQRADCLKFVMCAPKEEYSPYCEVPAWAHEWTKNTQKQIFVSPMNMYKTNTTDEKVSFWGLEPLDHAKNQLNHAHAAQYCMKYGFTLNLQLHLFADLP